MFCQISSRNYVEFARVPEMVSRFYPKSPGFTRGVKNGPHGSPDLLIVHVLSKIVQELRRICTCFRNGVHVLSKESMFYQGC